MGESTGVSFGVRPERDVREVDQGKCTGGRRRESGRDANGGGSIVEMPCLPTQSAAKHCANVPAVYSERQSFLRRTEPDEQLIVLSILNGSGLRDRYSVDFIAIGTYCPHIRTERSTDALNDVYRSTPAHQKHGLQCLPADP
jgi:hypothetical protein